MAARAVKWWGWGWEDHALPLESRPVLWKLLCDKLQVPPNLVRAVVPLDQIGVPPSLLSPTDLTELESLVGEENVAIDNAARITHAFGKGYKDLVRLRAGRVERAPDAVVYPPDEAAVRNLLEFARRKRYAVVPFGGGTSVVGGVEPPQAGPAITVDLRRMQTVRALDEESGLATVDAGIRGPLLEEALNAHGLTLGHFPQSWEFSTVGGWIATRAAGGMSNRYGRIEELVVGVRLVSPTRTLDLRALPNEAHGPDLKELILGSEGALGIVTRATLRAHPLPPERRFAGRLFRSFEDGLAALRAMARDGSLPDMAYLSDEEETRFAAASAGYGPEGGGATRILSLRGYSLQQGSLLLMAFEGSPARVGHLQSRALGFCGSAANVGASPAERWYAERFETPYLRDSLLDHGILTDTVETAAPWSNLRNVYLAGQKALQVSLWEAGTSGMVLCHVSHVYPDGASLYFTFFGRQRPGDEIAQWEKVKAAVTQAFVDAGGALSHHHGIGAEHAPYLGRVIGEDGLVVLRALKRELDPEGIMNPGKLLAART